MKNQLQLTIISLFAMALTINLNAQVWNTVGNGVSSAPFVGHVIKTAKSDSNLYVGCMPTQNFINTDTEIFKWNGSIWTTSPKLAGFYLIDFEVLNGEVVVIGYNSSTPKIYSLKNNTWTDITPPGLAHGMFKIIEHAGNLVITGSYTAGGGINDIMRYDGTGFYPYPTLPRITYIWDAAVFQGDLYVSGQDSFNGAPYDSTLYRFNSGLNVWETKLDFIQGTGNSNQAKRIMVSPSQMYLYDFQNHVLALNNDTAVYIATLPHAVNEYTSLNGKLYAVGTQQTGFNNMTMIDGSSVVALLNTPDSLKATNTLNGELYVIDKYATSWNGTTYNRAFRTSFSSLTGYLKVTSFLDKNGNGSFDSTDQKLPYVWSLVSTGNSAVTNHNGEATVLLQSGQHALSNYGSYLSLGKNINKTLQTPFNYSISTNQTTALFLPFDNTVQFDAGLRIYPLLGWRARHGFREAYKVVVSNYGYDTLSSPNVMITVPSSTPIDSVPPAAQTSGQTIVYSLPDIPPLGEFEFWYYTRIDTSTNNVNDMITTFGSVSVGGEKDPSDNIDSATQQIVGAYDPNDKQASSKLIMPGTKSIDYHIRFQNTGNDTAYKVVVTDSLDLSNPITSVLINSASHPYTFSVVGNMLVWEFDNILLPDSTTDLQGSQGYVNFTANLNPSLGVGDTVYNNADIYFDFQHPIRTNTAKTTYIGSVTLEEDSGLADKLIAYPNPARTEVHIDIDQADKALLVLHDMAGRLVMQKQGHRATRHTLDVSHLPQGVYILSIESGSETATFKIMVE